MQIINRYADLLKEALKKGKASQSWNKEHWSIDEEALLAHATVDQLEAVKKLASKDMNEKVPGSARVYREFKELERRARSMNQLQEATKAANFDPKSVQIHDLLTLSKVLKTAIEKTSEHRWIFVKIKGYLETPLFVSSIEYTAPSRRTTERVTVSASAIIGKENPRLCTDTYNIYGNVFRNGSVSLMSDIDNDDLDNDGDDEGRTRIVRKKDRKQDGVSLDTVLARADFYLSNPMLMKSYQESYRAYSAVADKVGTQWIPSDESIEGISIQQDENSYYRWQREKTVSLTVEGLPSRLVLDDCEEEGYDDDFNKATGFEIKDGDDDNDSSDFWNIKNPVVPTIPVVRMFDLQRDFHIFVAANSIIPYQYDKAIWEKLILPESDMEFIQILLSSTTVNISDIVRGKARGIITICSGGPGLGKTLTAEASSEAFEKPFYSVQCSQLGIDPEQLEKNLLRVLSRAARWEAILLLDEADVYVRRRGDDIQQNAIVGVFLRVLEYYRGIMFMTTNLGDDIDDAILSRATAHLHYELPTTDLLPSLWTMLSKQLTVNFTDADVGRLVEHFGPIAGRSVRNLIKLTKYYAVAKKKQPSSDMVLKVSKYLNVVELALKEKLAPKANTEK